MGNSCVNVTFTMISEPGSWSWGSESVACFLIEPHSLFGHCYDNIYQYRRGIMRKLIMVLSAVCFIVLVDS